MGIAPGIHHVGPEAQPEAGGAAGLRAGAGGAVGTGGGSVGAVGGSSRQLGQGSLGLVGKRRIRQGGERLADAVADHLLAFRQRAGLGENAADLGGGVLKRFTVSFDYDDLGGGRLV